MAFILPTGTQVVARWGIHRSLVQYEKHLAGKLTQLGVFPSVTVHAQSTVVL